MPHLCTKSSPLSICRALCCAALAAALGCATVRAPVSTFDDPLPPPSSDAANGAGQIDPRVEFWLEATGPVLPGEQAQAAQDARAALAQVVGAQAIDAHALGAEQPLLFVRERAVGRTSSRRTDQTVAKVGIVLVVAAVVVAAVIGAGDALKGASHAKALPVHGGGHVLAGGARGLAPHAVGRPIGPGSFARGGGVPHGPLGRTAPVRRMPPGWRALRAADGALELYDGLVDPWIELAIELDADGRAQAFAQAALDDEEEVPPPPPEPILPPVPDFDWDGRGFFSGDETLLQLDLIDRASGALLWSTHVQGDIDARDARDLAALLRKALSGQPWSSPIARPAAAAPTSARLSASR